MREKTNLTLHPHVKNAALALAESQGRSLSELVERLLEREIERNNPPSQGFGQNPLSASPTSNPSSGRQTSGKKTKSRNASI